MLDDVRRALEQDTLIDITTIGRKTGLPHRLEIWFHLQDDKLYLTGSPGRRGWYANLLADPNLTFHVKQSMERDIPARATPITDQAKRKEVLGRMRTLEDRMQHVVVDEWAKHSPLVEVDLRIG
jgi:deazaflavin-dependent oxidoreductase (nitroreductase family)